MWSLVNFPCIYLNLNLVKHFKYRFKSSSMIMIFCAIYFFSTVSTFGNIFAVFLASCEVVIVLYVEPKVGFFSFEFISSLQ